MSGIRSRHGISLASSMPVLVCEEHAGKMRFKPCQASLLTSRFLKDGLDKFRQCLITVLNICAVIYGIMAGLHEPS